MFARHKERHFRWKKDEVFLSKVLWGERVGLLQENDRWFTVYFAQHPIALFDSHQLRVAPLLTNSQLSSNRTRKCQICARSKMSGIPPATHRAHISSASIPSGGSIL